MEDLNKDQPTSYADRRVDIRAELTQFREILFAHIEHFKNHEEEEKKNYGEILKIQKDTNEKIAGLLEAWEIATNSIKALGLLGSVLKWITGVAIAIGSVLALSSGNFPFGK